MEGCNAMEQRRHPRIYEPFPVLVRGVDVHREAFVIETRLDDFSASGLYLRPPWPVAVGARLFAVVRITMNPLAWEASPRVAVHGVVRRVEPRLDGTYGVGMAFTRHRFL